ncbi:MAG: IS5 family transposase [Gemmataceae bacterium]
MRGRVDEQPPLFHVFSVEDRIRPDHPLRDVKRRVDAILATMDTQFTAAYRRIGRPSVPPERLLKALLLMALYSIRSERQLCERIDTDLLFRWFLDLQPSDEAFDPTTFCKNRDRLEEHRLTQAFFDAVVGRAVARGLCSEHFSVDGTLIESFAAAKSFRPKGEPDDREDGNGFQPRNPEVDFRGQKRSNDTHASRTDPEARLYRKGVGQEAKLAHMGHLLAENRHGLIVGVAVSEANGTAERQAALDLLTRAKRRHRLQPTTLGADKGYDAGQFFRKLERRKVTPHVPIVKPPRDPRTVPQKDQVPDIRARRRMQARLGTDGYSLSQRCRKKIEEGIGWIKTVAGLARSRWVGRWKLRQMVEVAAAAYNLVRMRRLIPTG